MTREFNNQIEFYLIWVNIINHLRVYDSIDLFILNQIFYESNITYN